MPPGLSGRYQNYTRADMSWLSAVDCPLSFTTLEDGVTDYVANYLETADPYL